MQYRNVVIQVMSQCELNWLCNDATVCFKIKDTSPIVSLLFWLNGDLLNLWGKSRLIVIAMSLQDFKTFMP